MGQKNKKQKKIVKLQNGNSKQNKLLCCQKFPSKEFKTRLTGARYAKVSVQGSSFPSKPTAGEWTSEVTGTLLPA